MKTRLWIATGAAALLLSTAPAPAGTSVAEASADTGASFLAVCPDGSEWLAVLTPEEITDGAFMGSVAIFDAALSAMSDGCVGLVLAPAPGGAPASDPGEVTAQDAAVWSRGTSPDVRASDAL